MWKWRWWTVDGDGQWEQLGGWFVIFNSINDDIDDNNYDDIGENCDDDGGGLRSWVADL